MIWPCPEVYVEYNSGAVIANRLRRYNAIVLGSFGKAFELTPASKEKFVPWVAERRIRSLRRARGIPEVPDSGFPTCDNMGV